MTEIASMDMLISVGFGVAIVTKDDEEIYREALDVETPDDVWTTADAEKLAAADPDHDWRITLVAQSYEKEYQRQGKDRWVLISSGLGFA